MAVLKNASFTTITIPKKRTFKERFFSLPWKPWKKYKQLSIEEYFIDNYKSLIIEYKNIFNPKKIG